MQHPFIPGAALLVIVPLAAWRLYVRLRRMVGRQRFSRVRAWLTVIAFPAVAGLLALATALTRPVSLAWLAAGLATGAALGVIGLRRTQFEATDEGLFYTPDARLGIGVILILVARIVYRLVQVYLTDEPVAASTDNLTRSPWTLLVFGLLAGFYTTSALGLLLWRHRVRRGKRG
jgi:hypothetical protein